jgi:hypothetical protein
MGFPHRNFLLKEIDLFQDIRLFYMNSSMHGRHNNNASLMDNDVHSDLRGIKETTQYSIIVSLV